MRNKPFRQLFTALLILSASMTSITTHAADETLSGINVGELGRVQSDTILFKAKAERLKALREAEGGHDLDNYLPSTGLHPTPQLPTTVSEAPRPASRLPVVRAITGSPQRLRANLLYSSGYEFNAGVGSELPDGYRVHQITLEGVVLSRKGERFPLGFSKRAPSSDSATGAQTGTPSFNLSGQLPGQ